VKEACSSCTISPSCRPMTCCILGLSGRKRKGRRWFGDLMFRVQFSTVPIYHIRPPMLCHFPAKSLPFFCHFSATFSGRPFLFGFHECFQPQHERQLVDRLRLQPVIFPLAHVQVHI